MGLRKFKINDEEHWELENVVKDFLLKHLRAKRYIRVHWEGCSESAKLLLSGKIKGIGRVGCKELAEPTIYEDFDTWFEESIIEENAINIDVDRMKDNRDG